MFGKYILILTNAQVCTSESRFKYLIESDNIFINRVYKYNLQTNITSLPANKDLLGKKGNEKTCFIETRWTLS